MLQDTSEAARASYYQDLSDLAACKEVQGFVNNSRKDSLSSCSSGPLDTPEQTVIADAFGRALGEDDDTSKEHPFQTSTSSSSRLSPAASSGGSSVASGLSGRRSRRARKSLQVNRTQPPMQPSMQPSMQPPMQLGHELSQGPNTMENMVRLNTTMKMIIQKLASQHSVITAQLAATEARVAAIERRNQLIETVVMQQQSMIYNMASVLPAQVLSASNTAPVHPVTTLPTAVPTTLPTSLPTSQSVSQSVPQPFTLPYQAMIPNTVPSEAPFHGLLEEDDVH